MFCNRPLQQLPYRPLSAGPILHRHHYQPHHSAPTHPPLSSQTTQPSLTTSILHHPHAQYGSSSHHSSLRHLGASAYPVQGGRRAASASAIAENLTPTRQLQLQQQSKLYAAGIGENPQAQVNVTKFKK